MNKYRVFISFGSNIDDKAKNCHRGITALLESGVCKLISQSRLYETAPADFREQDWFVNGVMLVETKLEPFQLLEKLKDIEREAGRKETVRFGPRVLDMDIIFFEDLVIDSNHLQIPHPRMQNRRFVLEPLCDIAPTMVHPVLRKSMLYLLENLNDTRQETRVM